MKGIMELVSEMHKRKHLDWLEDSWKENKPFILCLLNTGGLPRALELFLEELDSRARMNKLNLDQMTTKDPELAYSMFVIAPKINQLFVVSKNFVLFLGPKKDYVVDMMLRLTNQKPFILKYWLYLFLAVLFFCKNN